MLQRINIEHPLIPAKTYMVESAGIFIMYFTILHKYLLNMKQKTIYITEELHTNLKIFCATNKLKLNSHAEEVLRKYGMARTVQQTPKPQK